MAWMFIVVSLIVLWVASLCKILTQSASEAKFLKDGGRRNVLLVIAHPDDESMFFTPIINYLTSRGHNLHILCMSTGNAAGLGDARRGELYLASATLKVPPKQVKVVDHPDLQDGFGNVWDMNLLAKIISEEIQIHSIDLILTFDKYGVSGHCNHRDIHQGVRKVVHGDSQGNVEAWELVSTNLLRKYIGAIDIWLSILDAKHQNSTNGQIECFLNENPSKSYAAMAQHKSQWVWFRKLFVSFSSYTFVNTLKKIK